MKLTKIALASAILGLSMSVAQAEAIVGNWKTASGETASISSCGGSYCIKVETGKHKGKRIGKLAGSNGSYNGTVTDPADDKQYTGSAKVSGSKMSLKGCALKVFCKTQKWTKL